MAARVRVATAAALAVAVGCGVAAERAQKGEDASNQPARPDKVLMAAAEPPAPESDGRVIKAASCSQGDVQRAIDAARDGDTVLVPAGTATWTPTGKNSPSITILNKTVTLRGSGIDKTVITDGNTHAWKDLLVAVSGRKPARVTGFTFKGTGKVRGSAPVKVSGGCRGWRVDHCRFESTGRGVWSYDDSFGLIDNCLFIQTGQGVAVKGNGPSSWKKPLGMGTPDAVYVEDCTFTNDQAEANWSLDAYHGARYVFRHNTLIGNISLGHHGCDSGNYRSTMSYEIYHNTMKGKVRPRGMHFRGGTGVVFNNVLSGYKAGIDAANYRSNKQLAKSLCGKWGACDGTNPVDGNEEPNGYPGLDQIGRSTDQILEPLYEWNNTLNGKDADIEVSTGRQHIEENRDFYNDTRRPGYKPYTYPHPLREQWPPLPARDRQAPSGPTNLSVKALSDRAVEMRWEAPSDGEGVRGYYIWRNGKRMTTVTDPGHTQYTWLRLKPPLAQYTFAVSAFDAAGNESKPSASVSSRQRRGIAAKYPGDRGIEGDPAVVFADGFEDCSSPADLRRKWDVLVHDGNMRIAGESANINGGKRSLEFTVPKQEAALAIKVSKKLKKTHDVLFLRWYTKFEKGFFVRSGSVHNGASISSRYFDRGRATPGVPGNGRNKFLASLQNENSAGKSPGPVNIYIYHAEQRSRWGDHFFPSGKILPFSKAGSGAATFGKQFVARPDIIPQLGRWYCYEYMLKANTVGRRDGRITIWLDGRLIADFPNLRLRDIDALKIDRFGLGLYIAKNTVRANRKWYDDVVAATSYIGPMVPAKKAPATPGEGP